jgi:hypothetical protein
VLVPEAQAAAAPPPLMGAAATDQPGFDKLVQAVGELKSRRSYDGAIPNSFAESKAASDVAAGRVSYWSVRPDAKTFARDTAQQAKLSRFLDTIPKGHKTVVIAMHEPEEEINRGDYTLAQWASMNNKVSEIVKAKMRPELRFGISLLGPWTFDSRSPYYKYKWESVLDFSRIDVVGIDPYKFKFTDPSLERMLTYSNSGWGTTPNPSTMEKLVSWGKPIALTEWGIVSVDRFHKPIPDSTRAAWIKEGYAWMKSWNATQPLKIEVANYFHLRPAGGPYLTGAALSALDSLVPDARVSTTGPPTMGAATSDDPSFDKLAKAAGPLKARRSYDRAIPDSFAASKAAADWGTRRTSYWSFRPNAKTFATDTVAQEKLSAFLDTVPSGHRMVVFALHSPEAEIDRGDFTLAQWGATNNKVSEIVKAKKRPELRFGISLRGPWTFDSRSPYYKYTWESVLDFNRVDLVGINPYKFRTTDPSLEQMLTRSNSGRGTTPNPSTMAKLSSWGKPIVLTEWGVVSVDRSGTPISDATRADWIKAGSAWMRSWNAKQPVKIEAANYFHLRPEGGCFLTGAALTAFNSVTS